MSAAAVRSLTRAPVRIIPTSAGLSAIYRCRTVGCVAGECAECTMLRRCGTRYVCSCGQPLTCAPSDFPPGESIDCPHCERRVA